MMTRALGWLAILLLAMLLTPNPANAQRLELGLGQSHFSQVDDDIWFTRHGNYPFSNNLTTDSAALGLSGDVTGLRWGKTQLGWRIWMVDLGNTSNTAVWSRDEQAYLRGDYSLPAYNEGNGTGSAYGVTVGPKLEYLLTNDLSLGVETGVFLYRASWTEEVRVIGHSQWTRMSECPNCAGAHTALTAYLGATVRYRWLFASARYYRHVHGMNSMFGGPVRQFLAGVSVPFGR
ncbi:MAG: hypothetical protein ACRD52_00595 [Candidatus Acidiferrales bacterium]